MSEPGDEELERDEEAWTPGGSPIDRVTFWSRSRQEYWRKGDTSGHVQYVRSAALDCDADTLLVTVEQVGAACHTGTRACFDGDPLQVVQGAAPAA